VILANGVILHVSDRRIVAELALGPFRHLPFRAVRALPFFEQVLSSALFADDGFILETVRTRIVLLQRILLAAFLAIFEVAHRFSPNVGAWIPAGAAQWNRSRRCGWPARLQGLAVLLLLSPIPADRPLRVRSLASIGRAAESDDQQS